MVFLSSKHGFPCFSPGPCCLIKSSTPSVSGGIIVFFYFFPRVSNLVIGFLGLNFKPWNFTSEPL